MSIYISSSVVWFGYILAGRFRFFFLFCFVLFCLTYSKKNESIFSILIWLVRSVVTGVSEPLVCYPSRRWQCVDSTSRYRRPHQLSFNCLFFGTRGATYRRKNDAPWIGSYNGNLSYPVGHDCVIYIFWFLSFFLSIYLYCRQSGRGMATRVFIPLICDAMAQLRIPGTTGITQEKRNWGRREWDVHRESSSLIVHGGGGFYIVPRVPLWCGKGTIGRWIRFIKRKKKKKA